MHSMQEVCLEGTENALNHCPWIHSVVLSFGFSREKQEGCRVLLDNLCFQISSIQM